MLTAKELKKMAQEHSLRLSNAQNALNAVGAIASGEGLIKANTFALLEGEHLCSLFAVFADYLNPVIQDLDALELANIT
jgi:hypothetical protein